MATNTNSLLLSAAGSQYASISHASQTGLNITGDITLEAYVYHNSFNVVGNIIAKDDFGYPSEAYRFYTQSSDSKYCFAISTDGSNLVTGTATTALSINTWYHLAVVYNSTSGTCAFFLNGTADGAKSGLPTSIFNGTAGFALGMALNSGAPTSSNGFDGLIDEARVWNVQRTPSQILTNIQFDVTGQTGLKGFWKLNNDYTDSSGNGNTLIPSNSNFSGTVPFADYTGGPSSSFLNLTSKMW